MSQSTLLLYTQATGHVLAGATVASPASAAVTAEALAGETFPIRYMGNPSSSAFGVVTSALPASALAVLSVDSDVAPISQARTKIVNPKDKSVGSLNSTQSVSGAGFSGNARNALNVTISTAQPDKIAGLIRIARSTPSVPADAADVQLVNFDIPAPSTSVTVPVQVVPQGTFFVMVLVQGLPPYLSTIT
jgi:hypothetical protein